MNTSNRLMGAALAGTFLLAAGGAFAEPNAAMEGRDESGHRIEQQVDPSVYSDPDSAYNRSQRGLAGDGRTERYERYYRNGYLSRQFLGDGYAVRNWRDYGVGAPPAGYRWVRVGNELMLVSRNSGRIANVYALR